MEKPSKTERLRRELYDVLFDKRIAGEHGFSDSMMNYAARQIADHLTGKYVLRRKKKR